METFDRIQRAFTHGSGDVPDRLSERRQAPNHDAWDVWDIVPGTEVAGSTEPQLRRVGVVWARSSSEWFARSDYLGRSEPEGPFGNQFAAVRALRQPTPPLPLDKVRAAGFPPEGCTGISYRVNPGEPGLDITHDRLCPVHPVTEVPADQLGRWAEDHVPADIAARFDKAVVVAWLKGRDLSSQTLWADFRADQEPPAPPEPEGPDWRVLKHIGIADRTFVAERATDGQQFVVVVDSAQLAELHARLDHGPVDVTPPAAGWRILCRHYDLDEGGAV